MKQSGLDYHMNILLRLRGAQTYTDYSIQYYRKYGTTLGCMTLNDYVKMYVSKKGRDIIV